MSNVEAVKKLVNEMDAISKEVLVPYQKKPINKLTKDEREKMANCFEAIADTNRLLLDWYVKGRTFENWQLAFKTMQNDERMTSLDPTGRMVEIGKILAEMDLHEYYDKEVANLEIHLDTLHIQNSWFLELVKKFRAIQD